MHIHTDLHISDLHTSELTSELTSKPAVGPASGPRWLRTCTKYDAGDLGIFLVEGSQQMPQTVPWLGYWTADLTPRTVWVDFVAYRCSCALDRPQAAVRKIF